MDPIFPVICAAIRKVKPSLAETELTPQTRFDQFFISSIEMAMIVFEVSDHFDLEIEPYMLLTVATIGEACSELQKMRQSQGHALESMSDA